MEAYHKRDNAGFKRMEEMMELFTNWIGEQVNQTRIYKFEHGHIKDKIGGRTHDFRLQQQMKVEVHVFVRDMHAYGWVHKLKTCFKMRVASEK